MIMFKWLRDFFAFKPKGRYIIVLQAILNNRNNTFFGQIYSYMLERHQGRSAQTNDQIRYYIKRLTKHGYIYELPPLLLYRNNGPRQGYVLTPKGLELAKREPQV